MYAEKFLPQVIQWRRQIHSHPELSQHEENTAGLVANVLEGLGLEVRRNVGGFGVVGLLRGNGSSPRQSISPASSPLPRGEQKGGYFLRGEHKGGAIVDPSAPPPCPPLVVACVDPSASLRSTPPLAQGRHETNGTYMGKTIALRADMDALPLNEETELPYASQTPGVMHACGHDTHTAMLLGAACALSGMRENLRGNVKFIFQPSEELNPVGGAPGMIHDGVLDSPHVDGILALHVWPAVETGKIAVRSGSCMAASDRVYITVKGKTAHGSRPDQGNDAILTAAHVITGLQGIISRNVSPLDSAVITIGTIHGGYRYNVIPDNVKLEGTVRTLNPAVQEVMPAMIERVANGIAAAYGASCEVEYVKGYPPLVNDAKMSALACEAVSKIYPHAVIAVNEPDLAAEDFAFFARERPAVMAWLGCRASNVEAGNAPMLHNTKFCPDENCFALGIDYFVQSALDFLNAE